jgi:recombination protein RecT
MSNEITTAPRDNALVLAQSTTATIQWRSDVEATNYRNALASAVRKTPKLAQCSPESISIAVSKAQRVGVLYGQADNVCDIVPYNNKDTGKLEAQLQWGYQGLIAIAYQNPRVKKIYAAVIYEGDFFDYELGLTPHLKHKPTFNDAQRGEKTGAYAVCTLADAEPEFIVLTKGDIRAAESQSKMKFIWQGPFAGEMWKKTALRRLCKIIPKNQDLSQAVADDERAEYGDFPHSTTAASYQEPVFKPLTPGRHKVGKPVAPVATVAPEPTSRDGARPVSTREKIPWDERDDELTAEAAKPVNAEPVAPVAPVASVAPESETEKSRRVRESEEMRNLVKGSKAWRMVKDYLAESNLQTLESLPLQEIDELYASIFGTAPGE